MENWGVILGSGVIVALITFSKEIVLWIAKRRALKQDKKELKEEKQQEKNDEQADQIAELQRLVNLGFEEINSKFTEFGDDLQTIHKVINELNKKQDNQCEALQAQLGNTIEYLAGKYLRRKKITSDELHKLELLFRPYEKNGGNGTRAEMFHRCKTQLDIVDVKEINS